MNHGAVELVPDCTCAACAERRRELDVLDALTTPPDPRVRTPHGQALIAAIHQAEDEHRGKPGYLSGVRATGTDHHLHPGNRVEAA